MLIEFSVENYRSIRERAVLSLVATGLDTSKQQLLRDNVTAVSPKLSLLRSVIIYGANASGKSNMIKAFNFFRSCVANSARESRADDLIDTEPFMLQEDSRYAPSTFEVVFLLNETQYRYGFIVTQKQIVTEWLYQTPPGKREATLFTRDENGIRIPQHSEFREGRGLDKLTRPNALFLSVVAQFNGEIAKQLQRWLVIQCRLISGVTDNGYMTYTQECIEEGRYHTLIERLVKDLDLDIFGLSAETATGPSETHLVADAEEETRRVKYPVGKIKTRHAIRDSDGNITRYEDFDLIKMESDGTQKIIALCGPLFDVLTNGRVFFVDEIDARLHPLLTHAIIRLFNSPETNPKNAQLICATHDTNLLDRNLLRRDQIYFTEKSDSATKLYSLADFKLQGSNGKARTVRNDASFEGNYIEGRYGAIPYLGDLHRLFSEEVTTTTEETNGK